MTIAIAERPISSNVPVFVIAECGSSHIGRLEFALEMIDRVADAGADAAKFQMFRVDRFFIPRENAETMRPFELPGDWLPRLKERCDDNEIAFLCTAFDPASLLAVDQFVEAHKLSSYEAQNELWRKWVIDLGKPVLYSQGMHRASTEELADPRVIPLLCTSEYPADPRDYLIYRYGTTVKTLELPALIPVWGVSDHTRDPLVVPMAATALGAAVIEKHVGLGDRSAGSPDQIVAIGVSDFGRMVQHVRWTQDVVGRTGRYWGQTSKRARGLVK